MDKHEMIKMIMEGLMGEMEDSPDEIGMRLGRQPKGVEVAKIEMEGPIEESEELLGKDLDGDMEMGENPEHAAMVLDEGMSPDEKIKQRLMKIRG